MPADPLLQARDLARTFAGQLAVDGVELCIQGGEVVGLLGPNGAGKTTNLRMLAGSLAATRGTVRLAGVDLASEPQRAKRALGYLPERPPLYDEMIVADFLVFCARLHEVSEPASAARAALDRVGVADVAGRLIGHLSKGYRQRVGLAAALVHRPRVLLLDEPASGLDPAQRVAMRSLVAELASTGVAVLLSTHVLAEVALVCDRVLVMHRGRIVGEHALRGESGTQLRLTVRRPEGLAAGLSMLDGVAAVEVDADDLVVHTGSDVREAVARVAAEHGLLAMGINDGLEARYLQLVTEGV